MAAFGDLMASAVVGSPTQALDIADLGFDFSILKIPAPDEYRPVGESLSRLRRKEAEDGRIHSTARKLSILFSGILPDTPQLIRSYGLRASEICEASVASESHRHNDGIFSDYEGVDATSLWAAATSGPEAIKLHLLACILARIWNSSEATSIWVELVAERKKRIFAEYGESGITPPAPYLAAKRELGRSQLARWDASARAWLQTADAFKRSNQIQVDTILNDVDAAVNSYQRVYESVISAWTASLNAMESLVKGLPQTAQTGAILLGISSWHLYPDLTLMLSDFKDIKVDQRDPLVGRTAVLTIAISNNARTGETGVTWTLPLGHMNYYGDPVLVTRNLVADGRRLTVNEFFQAVLGAVIGGTIPCPVEHLDIDTINTMTEWFVILNDMIHYPDRNHGHKCGKDCDHHHHHDHDKDKHKHPYKIFDESWTSMLSRASTRYLESSGKDRHRYLHLIQLGNRYSDTFLPPLDTKMLGFSGFIHLFRLADSADAKAALFRRFVQGCIGDEGPNDFLIRVSHACERRLSSPGFFYEFAMARPFPRSSTKRKRSGDITYSEGYTRWLGMPTCGCFDKRDIDNALDLLSRHPDWKHRIICKEPFPEEIPLPRNPDRDRKLPPLFLNDPCLGSFLRRLFEIQDLGEEVEFFQSPKSLLSTHFFTTAATVPKVIQQALGFDTVEPYDLVTGSLKAIALIRRREPGPAMEIPETDTASHKIHHYKFPPHAVLEVFKEHKAKFGKFDILWLDLIWKDLLESDRMTVTCLKALASVAHLYKDLHGATINASVLGYPLFRAAWLPEPHSDQYQTAWVPLTVERFELTRQRVFSCICLLESGYVNLRLNDLGDVMAVSVGNSIYVSESVISDPGISGLENKVRRISGNIGKPGISLLVPPGRIRKSHCEFDQQMVDYANGGLDGEGRGPRGRNRKFDGKIKDYFKDTGLKLTLTGFTHPIDIRKYGRQDSEVNLVESVVSVEWGGKWVADFDITLMWRAVRRHKFECGHRRHDRVEDGDDDDADAEGSTRTASEDDGAFMDLDDDEYDEDDDGLDSEGQKRVLKGIKDWLGFFFREEEGDAVFLAEDNWQARIAATCLVIADLDTRHRAAMETADRRGRGRKETKKEQLVVAESMKGVCGKCVLEYWRRRVERRKGPLMLIC